MWRKDTSQKKSLAILVAEDNPHDQLLFAMAVDDGLDDASVSFANDGVDILDEIETRSSTGVLPDIVVLDLQMPRMDGHETLAKIRENRALDDIPVVVFTSSSRPEEAQRSHNSGATDHVTKPSTYEELLTFVGSLSELTAR